MYRAPLSRLAPVDVLTAALGDAAADRAVELFAVGAETGVVGVGFTAVASLASLFELPVACGL